MKHHTCAGNCALWLAVLAAALVFLGCPPVDSDNGSTDTVAAPVASPAPGAVAPGTAVQLDTATPGALIYYTLDGAAPTRAGSLYGDPISVTAALTIKAVAVKDGMDDSDVLTASYTVNPGDEGDNVNLPPLPQSSGTNQLAGTTYYGSQRTTNRYLQKIEFTSGTSTGTYRAFVYISTGYTPSEEGAYSWNQEASTVTLKPSKTAIRESDTLSALLTRTEYWTFYQEWLEDAKADMGEAAYNAQLAALGFASEADYLRYYIAQEFGNRTYNYAFSSDADAILFMDEQLPSSTGTNHLAGQTYNGRIGSGGSQVKNPNVSYTFMDNGEYHYADTANSSTNHEGTYAYNGQYKSVLLKRSTGGRLARYNGLKAMSDSDLNQQSKPSGGFPLTDRKDIIAYLINERYQVTQHGYDPEDKTL
jgi:hypothetical protein